MSRNKTRPTRVSAASFLSLVQIEQRRRDGQELLSLMEEITGEPPIMWGPSIIGFGRYHYKYESGREGDMMIVGFSPRKQNLVLYLGSVLQDENLMAALGKHRKGKGCLYINKLDDIDRNVLKKLITQSVERARQRILCR